VPVNEWNEIDRFEGRHKLIRKVDIVPRVRDKNLAFGGVLASVMEQEVFQGRRYWQTSMSKRQISPRDRTS